MVATDSAPRVPDPQGCDPVSSSTPPPAVPRPAGPVRLLAPARVARDRSDRCPGALRPWRAADGLLVRLRLVGGQVATPSLERLLDVAERHGDGVVHVTGRANLQVRALPADPADPRRVSAPVLDDLAATGLLPHPRHELVRNLLASPQTGLAGGRVDLRPMLRDLDARLCADRALADLPGRFLFVLDDGRGDVVGRPCDLGAVALDARCSQIRLGAGWGPVVPHADVARTLVTFARQFLQVRGEGPQAAWHVVELPAPLACPDGSPSRPDPRVPAAAGPLPAGPVPGGVHHPVPEHGLTRTELARWRPGPTVVVTPWRGVLVPEAGR